jgi:hypothetical protein
MGAPKDEAPEALNAELMRAVRQADADRIVIMEDGYRGLGTKRSYAMPQTILLHAYPRVS